MIYIRTYILVYSIIYFIFTIYLFIPNIIPNIILTIIFRITIISKHQLYISYLIISISWMVILIQCKK